MWQLQTKKNVINNFPPVMSVTGKVIYKECYYIQYNKNLGKLEFDVVILQH